VSLKTSEHTQADPEINVPRRFTLGYVSQRIVEMSLSKVIILLLV
jgi:hypothetical protein